MTPRARTLRPHDPAGRPTVYIVDDNDTDRDRLRAVVESIGHRAAVFAGARDFLDAYLPTSPGCLLLDLRMPGMDGLDLQNELNRRGDPIPVIFVTAFGETSSAVQAMRAGALDFLEKPCRERELLHRIEEAIELDAARRRRDRAHAELDRRFGTLSPREREVLDHVMCGEHSKQIAGELEISARTVDVHRANIMRKLGAHSIPELFRLLSGHAPDTLGHRQN
jgi:FixJ family two-component response regulator